jgi:hypothetical protein
MPLVNVRLIEGVFTPEQKRQMIHQLTETLVDYHKNRLEKLGSDTVAWCVEPRGAATGNEPATLGSRRPRKQGRLPQREVLGVRFDTAA